MKITPLVIIILICTITVHAGEYKPSFSEFSIEFPKQPREQIILSTADDGSPFEVVSVEAFAGGAMLKAEFVPVADFVPISAMSDDDIKSRALEYAKHNGVKVSHVTIETIKGIRVCILRATKILQNEGSDVAVTYVSKTYYGRKSIMILYVGAPSSSYPTDSINSFLSSVVIH